MLGHSKFTRRSLLKQSTALPLAGLASKKLLAQDHPKATGTDSLKAVAHRTGRLTAVFSGMHQLMTDQAANKIIPEQFDMLAIGNDLKMFRIHPDPDRYDFSYGDYDFAWAQRNGMMFRGHTLIWHNGLPPWVRTGVNSSNGKQVMTDHITTVMKHYAGKFYSWDVVNEPIRNIDGRPDGLRAWPWLQAVGPDYIDIAFHTAAEADPKTKLILNENNFEHDLPLHTQRRETLLQLMTNLKKRNVPVHGLGIQGHIRADTPLAAEPLRNALKQFHDLGLEIMITELDVDDTHIDTAHVDEAVARKYGEYLDIVGSFAKVITLEALADDPNVPKRPDGTIHRPNLFDSNYQGKTALQTAMQSLAHLPALPQGH